MPAAITPITHPVDTQYGVQATYWILGDMNVNWFTREGGVKLLGFIDQAAFDDGMEPVTTRWFEWHDGDEFPFTQAGCNAAEAYAAILADPEWAGGQQI